jgi:hypothetical protein
MDVVIIGISIAVAWLFWPSGGSKPGSGVKPFDVNIVKQTPAEVLAPLVAQTPTPGRFYQLFADAPNASGNGGVLAQALNNLSQGKGAIGSLRLAYLDELTTGWNAELYSRNQPTDSWPAAYNFRGINIGPAWLPRHVNAIEAIAAGAKPQRAIAADGDATGLGNSFGLLWLPELDETALAGGAIVVKQRADGSDPYYPPKELMDLLS